MNRVLSSVATIALAVSTTAGADDVVLTAFDRLSESDLRTAFLDQSRQLEFTAYGRNWSIELVRNARVPETATTIPLKGTLSGLDGSWVRLSERDGQYQGMIFDGTDYFALENDASEGLVFYALKDAVIAGAPLACAVPGGAESAKVTLQSELKALTGEVALKAAGASESVDIAVIGDSAFANSKATPEDDLTARFNVIDGWYSEQVGVTLNVVEIRVLDDTTDTFNTTDAEELLRDHLSPFKANDPALAPLGLVHLYTGKDLDGGTAGIAFRGVVCSRQGGVGLSEGRRLLTTDALIAAHEIGHNFSSPHDTEAGSACESAPDDLIMAPSLGFATQPTFSNCSLNFIRQHAAAASCLTSIEPIDVQPIFTNTPRSATVGQTFQSTLRIRNSGTDPSGTVTADLSAPASLTLDTASLPADCAAAGNNGAQCTLASIAGGSEAQLTFTLNAAAADPAADFEATVSATGDANTGNDSGARRIAVEGGSGVVDVDLGVSVTGATTLTDGDTADYVVTVTNAGTNPASSVALNVALPIQLGYTSDDRSCNVTNDTLACAIGTLAAGASTQLTVGISAGPAGNGNVDASVTTADNDTDPANDAATLAVSVQSQPAPPPAPSSSGSSGGGGAAGALLLALLSTVRIGGGRRARRRRTG